MKPSTLQTSKQSTTPAHYRETPIALPSGKIAWVAGLAIPNYIRSIPGNEDAIETRKKYCRR